MKRIFASCLLACSLLHFNCHSFPAASFEDQKKLKMIDDLFVIKHHLEAGYAASSWKKEFSGWDLDLAFEYYQNKILSMPSINTKEFQKIVREFLKTTQDYHVEVLFFSTEAASLPFSVKGAKGRYFISWIDPLRLPQSHYSIQVGDELLEFDDQPIAEVMERLIDDYGKFASSNTNQTMAEMKLTLRAGISGDVIPKGPISIKTRSSVNGKVKSFQLHWSYMSEHVKNPLDYFPLLDAISWKKPPQKIKQPQNKIRIPNLKMANPLHEYYAKKFGDREAGLGSSKSFIPMLGEPVWVKEASNESVENILEALNFQWYAYIYRHPTTNRPIGYIRIPHYMGFSMHAQEFGEILNYMESKTDALVIDQVHNFGGLVNFQYELASMLAINPLKTPHHRIKITQKEVLDAYNKIREIVKLIEQMHKNQNMENSPAENEKEDGEELALEILKEIDMGVNYQQMLFLKSYYELLLEEWHAGKTLTRPTSILGIDQINPHPKYEYTKPILMLIDEVDFSGADFMPAILQDNQRAILFGQRTAGAGGFIATTQFPNTHGIALISYTASIAERPNQQKIENIGVAPDVEYEITVNDLKNGYRDYIAAVNKTVAALIASKCESPKPKAISDEFTWETESVEMKSDAPQIEEGEKEPIGMETEESDSEDSDDEEDDLEEGGYDDDDDLEDDDDGDLTDFVRKIS